MDPALAKIVLAGSEEADAGQGVLQLQASAGGRAAGGEAERSDGGRGEGLEGEGLGVTVAARLASLATRRPRESIRRCGEGRTAGMSREVFQSLKKA